MKGISALGIQRREHDKFWLAEWSNPKRFQEDGGTLGLKYGRKTEGMVKGQES